MELFALCKKSVEKMVNLKFLMISLQTKNSEFTVMWPLIKSSEPFHKIPFRRGHRIFK